MSNKYKVYQYLKKKHEPSISKFNALEGILELLLIHFKDNYEHYESTWRNLTSKTTDH